MSNESVYLYRALRAVRVRVRHRRRPARDARVVPTTGVEPGGERVYFNLCVGNSIDVVFCFCFYIFFCLQVIDERLDGVSFFADNPGVSSDFEKIFRRRGGCPDAGAVLSSMAANVDKATSGMREWRSVYALLSTASDVLTCEFLFIFVCAIILTACFFYRCGGEVRGVESGRVRGARNASSRRQVPSREPRGSRATARHRLVRLRGQQGGRRR